MVHYESTSIYTNNIKVNLYQLLQVELFEQNGADIIRTEGKQCSNRSKSGVLIKDMTSLDDYNGI